MALRFFALAALVVLSTAGVSSAVAPAQRNTLHAASPPGDARLYAVGTRSVQQRSSAQALKMDSVLADLSRHLSRVRPAYPARRFAFVESRGEIRAACAQGDAAGSDRCGHARRSAEPQSGARGSRTRARFGVCQRRRRLAAGHRRSRPPRLAVSSSPSARPCRIRAAWWPCRATTCSRARWCAPITRGSQGPASPSAFSPTASTASPCMPRPEAACRRAATRATRPTVSRPIMQPISRRARCPRAWTCVQEADCLDYGAPTQTPFTDEGRAMLQIVHAVAPGAGLSFYSPSHRGRFGHRHPGARDRRREGHRRRLWAFSMSRSFRMD